MLTINELSREQLIELIELKNSEIKQLKEDITILEEVINELYLKIKGDKKNEGCCSDKDKDNRNKGCSCSCNK